MTLISAGLPAMIRGFIFFIQISKLLKHVLIIIIVIFGQIGKIAFVDDLEIVIKKVFLIHTHVIPPCETLSILLCLSERLKGYHRMFRKT